jgi:Domain of unknown function (DUF1851)
MFDRFLSTFSEAGQGAITTWSDSPQHGWQELLAAHGGSTFDDGLYRLHEPTTSLRADQIVAEAHPELGNRVRCFGYDWLGRQFAIDLNAPEAASVRMIEPGTGEVLVLPASFVTFHDSLLMDYRDAALASAFFESWVAGHRDALPLKADRCVGYRVPLFLGGDDNLGNLEETDLWLYWDISAQLIAQTRNLPAGTPRSGARLT